MSPTRPLFPALSLAATVALLLALAPASSAMPAEPTPDQIVGLRSANASSPPAAPTERAMVTDTVSLDLVGPASDRTPSADLHVTEERLSPFALIGASWIPAGDDGSAQVRIHDAAGWGPWQELHTEGATAEPSPDGRTVTDPIWVGAADGFELAVAGSVLAVEVHLVRPDAARADAVLDVAALADTATQLAVATANDSPVIHSRQEWGSRPTPAGGYDAAAGVRLAVLHHTVDTNNYSAADVPAMLRAIQAYHTDANRWDDIGYNFVVDRFGRIWEGRGGGPQTTIIGTHAAGVNTGSVGVAVLGDFRSSGPTRATVDAIVALLSWRLFLDGADPAQPARLAPRTDEIYEAGVTVTLPRIIGHGDVNFTTCPAGLRNVLGEIRSRVNAEFHSRVANSALSPSRLQNPTTNEAPVAADFDGDGDDDLLWLHEERVDIWRSSADGSFIVDQHPRPAGLTPLVADLDGNGTTDVFWWSTTQGDRDRFWMMNPGATIVERDQPIDGAIVPYTFDPDGDGDADVLWYDPLGGQLWIWISLGPRGYAQSFLGAEVGPGLVPTVIDPDGDARDDVLWYHPGRDTHLYWRSLSATTHDTHQVAAASGHRTGAADLDGDGFDDLVLSNSPTTVVAWGPYLDVFSSLPLGDLRQVSFADTNGGGAAELVAAGYDGTVTRYAFTLDRTALAGVPALYGSQFAVTADTDRDGRDELLATTSGGFERWSTR